jgi:hypothetical protein
MPYFDPTIPKILHAARLGHAEQLSKLCHIQIEIDVELKFLEHIHNFNFW